jgi:GH24 family phage-related lysozyme (muramidase)
MSSSTLTGFHNVSDYDGAILQILTAEETQNHVSADLLPYGDGAGHATIGIGFDLTNTYNVSTVLGQLGIVWNNTEIKGEYQKTEDEYYEQISRILDKNWSTGSSPALVAQINGILAARAKRPYVAALYKGVPAPTSFSLSVAQSSAAFTEIRPQYEALVNSFESGFGQSTTEYLALESLAWNSRVVSKKPTLFGQQLAAAIASGNRAEAWYEIRYDSNKSQSAGLAKRRDFESDLFGLYPVGEATVSTVSNATALQIFAMTTNHSNIIFGTAGIDPDDYVAAANSDYAIALGNTPSGEVQTLDEDLAPAAQYLITRYAPLQSIDDENILVYTQKNILGGESTDFSANTGNALVIVQTGSEIANGDVPVTMNDGNDTIYSDQQLFVTLGSGQDTLRLSGFSGVSEPNTITTASNDKLIIAGGSIANLFSGEIGTDSLGREYIYEPSMAEVAIYKDEYTSPVLLIQNFHNGDFGLTFNLSPDSPQGTDARLAKFVELAAALSAADAASFGQIVGAVSTPKGIETAAAVVTAPAQGWG